MRKLLRRDRGTVPAAEAQQFGAVLEQAAMQGGDPRRVQVARLAADGADLGSIARHTRLARDAVRSVLGDR